MGYTMMVAVIPLTAEDLLRSPRWSGAPSALATTGVAVGTVWLSRLIVRHGRRLALAWGYLAAGAMALVAADDVAGQRQLGRVELGVLQHSPEDLLDVQRQPGGLDALRPDAPVVQCCGTVIEPGGDRQSEHGGSLAAPVSRRACTRRASHGAAPSA